MLDTYRREINSARNLFALDMIEQKIKRSLLPVQQQALAADIALRRMRLEDEDGHWLDVEPGEM